MWVVVTDDEDTSRFDVRGDVSSLVPGVPKSSGPLTESALSSLLDESLEKGFAEPRTEGFNLKANLDVCGGDEPVTVNMGGVKKLEGGFTDPVGRPPGASVD